ncbi:M16 family metallopeptidase [Gracilinema caldarium]|uniref:Peptidase M16 domain protein n=1 Tax=Gracilinema caldarium (strain ATCC 51460 / DSM 7334 / H1) TaxID=744872 RepID=F8EWS7_GRAC1|nr:pitrilysin family protein [Gracilinema caldarium]AEJ18313.1 peptidase M16 domain protein [Gracilinema caldarium DSM 7334]
MNIQKRLLLGLCLLFTNVLCIPGAFSETGSASPLTHKVLPNGLEVFVVENHAVPLATVCVVFRGGASAQNPENAGIFHLYEHMLFAGNEKYPTQAAFTAALNRMGVPNWNGATGSQYINYFITVPSNRLTEGIEFWAWAVKKPVFNESKLEQEKEVVINEIRGYHTDPDHIFQNALQSRVFYRFPWRKNIDGPEENIQKTTVADLQRMRETYYIPRNTALMIAGDVNPNEAFKLAEQWFGDWQGGAAPVIAEPPQSPFPQNIKLAYADDTFYRGISMVQFLWRGPDVLRETKDTYTSDVLLYLLSSPVGRFKQTLMKKSPGLYDERYIDFSYPTSRDGGSYGFTTYFKMGMPDAPSLIIRTEALRKLLLEEFSIIAQNPESYFGKEELEKAKTKLIDHNLLSMEVASSFVTGTLTFWWSVASTDYFFSYEKNCKAVTFQDIQDLIRRYILGVDENSRPAVATAVRFSTADGWKEPGLQTDITSYGYQEISPETAFWWQQQR